MGGFNLKDVGLDFGRITPDVINAEMARLSVHLRKQLSNSVTYESRNQNIRLFPEIGSRAMVKLLTTPENTYSSWNIVQPETYMYVVNTDSLIVRMIIRDYLAVEVGWQDH
jgi:hypothetical protein